jgi:flagellar FliL protein
MEATKEAPEAATAAPAASGGIKPLLPLILNLVLMPVIAYALTQFVLLPKLRAPAQAGDAGGAHGAEPQAHEPTGDAHGEAKPAAHGDSGEPGEAKDGKDTHGGGGPVSKAPVPLGEKILVNVSGTKGTRYLQAKISLASSKPNLKSLIEQFDAQLRDAASNTLAAKTITDLEKPGARALIRTELIGAFNMILGNGTVSDIFLTDFAIQ